MKKIKFIGIFLILLLHIATIKLNATENNNISLFGYVTDNEGNSKAGVKVEVEGTSYSAITNSNGYYQIDNILPGNYSLKYDFTNLEDTYCIENASLNQFDKYTDKLEIAFVHTEQEQLEVDDYKNQINILSEQLSNSPRYIDRQYSDAASLRNIIRGLRNDSDNPNAFHKAHTDGWKSIAVICFTENMPDISPLSNNRDYDVIVKNFNGYKKDVIKGIYQKLLNKEAEESEINPRNADNIGQVNINAYKNSMINLDVRRDTSRLPIDQAYSDFIQGNIIADNNLVTDNIKVTLIKESGESVSTYSENGNYKFGYPTPGRYKLEICLDTKDINGQNYEVISDYMSINDTTNPSQNSINPENTNIEELKEKFRKIGYSEEKTLDNNTSECALICYTDWFYVTNPTNKKYAGIVLKERDKFSIETTSEINAFKIMLSDGQVLAEWTKGSSQNVNNVLTTSDNGAFVVTMDNELRYGATIYIEYNITLKNNSNIDCEEFTIISGNDLKYNEEAKLLTDSNVTNKDIGWKSVNNVSDYVSVSLNSSLSKGNYVQLQDSLQAGDSKTYRVITSELLDADCTYYDVTEIVEYKNIEGRRNFNSSGEKILAGSYWHEGITEADTGISQALLIMPPFGETNNLFIIVISILTLFIMVVIIYNRRKTYKIGGRKK